MLEKITYINHINEIIDGGKEGIYVNSNDLRDYAWDVKSSNNKISSFNKGIVSRTIPLYIYCNDAEEGMAIRNRLFEVVEKDVLAKEHGRIIIGDYYMKCYITGSKKKKYLEKYLQLSLNVKTDYPEWVKETTTAFNSEAGSDSEFLDYPYDYTYDYASELNKAVVINNHFVPSNFRIIMYGLAVNPRLFIGGHEYNVNVTVGAGEYLTIDSISKSIILTRNNGEQVNCFNLRNRDSYIFEKIGVGSNSVTCEGELKADIVLIEERSEPRWT
ncbi:hypothetical protein [Bacillus infantis]|uniref:hypothetical protein n=1 Tax=Bacillus infantis TaxID=324767 RepID=UPI003CF19B90